MNPEQLFLSLCIGVGLSAACGFRIFIPLFITSLASRSGDLALSEGFAWIGSDAALIAFGVATVVEIGAYYIPWLDNLLDTMASPTAVIAGTIVTASIISDVNPFLKWSLAIIAGGGAAGTVQAMTVFFRGASTLGTGGVANPVLATAELGGSTILGGMAIFIPFAAIIILPVVLGVVIWRVQVRRKRLQIEPEAEVAV